MFDFVTVLGSITDILVTEIAVSGIFGPPPGPQSVFPAEGALCAALGCAWVTPALAQGFPWSLVGRGPCADEDLGDWLLSPQMLFLG